MTEQEVLAKYPALKLRTPAGYLDRVLSFAETRGLLEQFLGRLGSIAKGTWFGEPCELQMFRDFAPWSFEWQICRGGEVVYNGGLIYFGAGDSGVDAPQLFVRLGDQSEGWSIHS